ncbi:MAG: site-specific integrase [Bacteroidetes bacterium]|nr:site-specific integrase [Bacteroidota bacterium]
MKTTNTFGVRFFIKKYKETNGKAPIYARVTVNGKPLDISLKREIEVAHWNPDRGIAKGSRDEIKSVNTYIEQVRAQLTNCYTELKIQKEFVTSLLVKNLFCGNVPEERTLLGLIEYHNAQMKTFLEWGTMKNYYTTQKYIEMFLKESYKTSDVRLSSLSYNFIVNLEIFLKGRQPVDHHKPCGHNTVLKHIERLRKMINLAIKNEWLDRDPFAKYQAKFIKNDRGFLSLQELEQIENKEFHIVRLQWAKDLFVFSCYTGLAYCDVMSLTPNNISLGIDGEYWVLTSRKKTNQPVRVPLLPKALALIEKYKGHPRAISSGTLFPVISNQKLNAYLKEISDLCDINKNLTFHLARHTFATTITLSNGVPIETVSKMLGHTSIKTTQIYAKVIEKKVSSDMLALRDKLLDKIEAQPRKAVLQSP